MDNLNLYLVTYETISGQTQIDIESTNLRAAEGKAEQLIQERRDLIRVKGIREYHHNSKNNTDR